EAWRKTTVWPESLPINAPISGLIVICATTGGAKARNSAQRENNPAPNLGKDSMDLIVLNQQSPTVSCLKELRFLRRNAIRNRHGPDSRPIGNGFVCS